MTFDEIFALVDPHWRAEFRDYIRTGKSSPGFAKYLASDPNCDRAADLAVEEIIRMFAEKPSPATLPNQDSKATSFSDAQRLLNSAQPGV